MNELEKLSSKKANGLRIWMPSQDGRKSLSQRAVSLYNDVGGFRVYAGGSLGYIIGRSRAVAASAASHHWEKSR